MQQESLNNQHSPWRLLCVWCHSDIMIRRCDAGLLVHVHDVTDLCYVGTCAVCGTASKCLVMCDVQPT